MDNFDNEFKPERSLAVSVILKGSDRDVALEHLDELEFLAETAGAEIIGKIFQELPKLNNATLLGKGKIEEIKLELLENDIKLIIFDNDLSPVQARNLENIFNIKVLDRSGLILDIFAKRARTIEAKTQVELAQLQYMLPRLTRMWTHLSKQYGGIGTKGPGETQIETDRRLLKTRIQKLKEKLKSIDVHRDEIKKNREGIPRFALVGYTNAGKSTLMNLITDASVYVEDKLFATLDTTVRSFFLSSGRKALISDTVGFIRKLPAHLVASFRSTLSEARDADVLLHVVDINHKFFKEHIKVVNSTLEVLKIMDKPVIMVFNKIDELDDINDAAYIIGDFINPVMISAKKGININALLEAMEKVFDENSKTKKILLPYTKMNLLNNIYQYCDVIKKVETDEGIIMELRIQPDKQEILDNLTELNNLNYEG